jgi:hypothetical protein
LLKEHFAFSGKERGHGNQVVENGVKLVGERILPGSSLMMDGDIKGGLAHAAVGLLGQGGVRAGGLVRGGRGLVLALRHRQGPDRASGVVSVVSVVSDAGPGAYDRRRPVRPFSTRKTKPPKNCLTPA